jgi:hypothetical protein
MAEIILLTCVLMDFPYTDTNVVIAHEKHGELFFVYFLKFLHCRDLPDRFENSGLKQLNRCSTQSNFLYKKP